MVARHTHLKIQRSDTQLCCCSSDKMAEATAPFAQNTSSGLNLIASLQDSLTDGLDSVEELASLSFPIQPPSLSAVQELVYWREPKKSATVFSSSLLVLFALATCSAITVVSYVLLAVLCVTITFRVYKSVIQAIQKSDEGHPFKNLMARDISISPQKFRRHVDYALTHINRGILEARRLLLVEDVVDSLKLAGVMWLLTFVGAVFNGITILILADIIFFSTPLVYEKNKTQIDRYIELVRSQIQSKLAKLQDKLPGAVKRSKAE
ncbi:reticulon-3-B-like isoform X1 [Alosa sapidissima]|uniref:reticulon-3-B-like isoform X1 n=1 Tax=Alosa sapidissima TaxID=34773 RepID=UPI001C085073|nr:reticulon-3-B-like isoform X1 [Alosa sapidissima]